VKSMVVTFETSQLETSQLKEVVPRNVLYMLVTVEVSQLDSPKPVKAEAP
jgi:hypothetical protein